MIRAMEILNEAIVAAGGVSALARHLGVKPNTVSNWRTRGLPPGYIYAFTFMRQDRSGLFDDSDVTNVIDVDHSIGALDHISSDRLASL